MVTKSVEDVVTKGRDVFLVFTQRWNGNWKDRQSVIKVLPEFAFANQPGEVAIGGSDNPGIDRISPVAAQPAVRS